MTPTRPLRPRRPASAATAAPQHGRPIRGIEEPEAPSLALPRPVEAECCQTAPQKMLLQAAEFLLGGIRAGNDEDEGRHRRRPPQIPPELAVAKPDRQPLRRRQQIGRRPAIGGDPQRRGALLLRQILEEHELGEMKGKRRALERLAGGDVAAARLRLLADRELPLALPRPGGAPAGPVAGLADEARRLQRGDPGGLDARHPVLHHLMQAASLAHPALRLNSSSRASSRPATGCRRRNRHSSPARCPA